MNRIKVSFLLTAVGLLGAFTFINREKLHTPVIPHGMEYLIFNKDGKMVYKFEKDQIKEFSILSNNGFVNFNPERKQEYYYVLNNYNEKEIFSGKIFL